MTEPRARFDLNRKDLDVLTVALADLIETFTRNGTPKLLRRAKPLHKKMVAAFNRLERARRRRGGVTA